jgi:hypothetical protein
VLGVFFGHLRLNRRDDQPLVRFAQLDVELFNLKPSLHRRFRGADGLLARPDRLFPRSKYPLRAGQPPLLGAHRVVAGRRLLPSVLQWIDCRFFVGQRSM